MSTVKPKTQEKNKMSEIDDQILKHFEIKKRLGKGAYGIVWKAIDRKTAHIVAVKKIFDAFRNETDAQRTFREIMFLRAFRNHPNVIQLHSIHKAANNLDIYLSFEFMESDLHNVIKRGSILKDVHKRYVMYQLLNAIKYIHSGNVIHRDLKPSNVLIDSKCRCKIADFGLARSVSQRQFGEQNNNVDPSEPILTDYVATRWYRAPEILVASKRYTKGIDMWSLGCILGEMIRAKPLFPGSSTVNQIERIVCSLPEVSEKDVLAVGAGFGSVLLNQQINANGNPKLDDLLSGAPEDSKSLVKSLLILDPARRLTAKQALCHRYVEKFRHSIPEAELNSDVLPPFRDDVQLTVPEYRSKLYEIMQTNDRGNGGGGGSGSGTKQTNLKNRDISAAKLESTITVTSSSISSAMKTVNARPEEVDKKSSSNHISPQSGMRKFDQRAFTPAKNSSLRISNSSSSTASKTVSNNTSGYSITNPSHDSKFKPITKIKYCKISTIPETNNKANFSTDIGDGEHRQNSLTYFSKTGTLTNDKRHSLDGSFSSDLSHTNQILPEKKPMHGSYRNLSNARIQQEDRLPHMNDNNLSYPPPSWSNRYSAVAVDGNTEVHIEKSSVPPPTKMTRNDNMSFTNDNGSYYERRLKNLEERIQRHKMDINALFAQNTKQKVTKTDSVECNNSSNISKKISAFSGPIISSSSTSNPSNGKFVKTKVNLNRSKSENNSNSIKQRANLKYDYTFSEGDRLSVKHKGPIPTSNEYGVVAAKELYDLRKSQVIS